MLNSRTLKVNTMQDKRFKELLGEFALHCQDLLEEYDLFEPRAEVSPIVPQYNVHDGGYVEFTITEPHQVKFERIQDEVARNSPNCSKDQTRRLLLYKKYLHATSFCSLDTGSSRGKL